MKKNKSKYQIILFCNKKQKRILVKTNDKEYLLEMWREYTTELKPRFHMVYGTKRSLEKKYELVLLYPYYPQSKPIYLKDDLGRSRVFLYDDNSYRIKKTFPYYVEELIYDYQQKKHIRYNELLTTIESIKDLGQVFTLNKYLFVQTDKQILWFSNKNINDANRLLGILREDIINSGKNNFIFVKDITTKQRTSLYNILEEKGIPRKLLFKHYSY